MLPFSRYLFHLHNFCSLYRGVPRISAVQ
uniref:Uncharacterized protein n=1 Tax=Anguilla anguilla TaxID=7936 RepID=A0A0E9PCU4_ANGAN